MQDVKKLYLEARSKGTSKSITAYTNAVHELLESNPSEYLLNAEYIISSSIGLSTFKEFVEKWGLPIVCYDDMMTILENCIQKAEVSGKNHTKYTEMVDYMESFRNKYGNCFAMYESLVDEKFDKDEYVATYYSMTESGIQRRKLPSIVSTSSGFGYAAIPDLIITADNTKTKNAMGICFEYARSQSGINDARLINQWLCECSKNIDVSDDIIGDIGSLNLEAVVNPAIERATKVYREAAIIGDDSAVTAYTEHELIATQQLISILEATMLEQSDPQKAAAIQQRIFSLYESLDGFIDESGNVIAESVSMNEDTVDSIIPNLPVATEDVAPWHMNTMNKKTGGMPVYISRNHDLDYGEQDGSSKNSSSSDDDPSFDDFRRPSADPAPESDDGDEESDSSDDSDDSSDTNGSGGGNNYYYYTYTNSLNQNKNSFNKDSSTHDDHSITRKTDDHSIKDDHSKYKRVSSDDYNKSDDEDDSDHRYRALESADDFSDFKDAKKSDKEQDEEMEESVSLITSIYRNASRQDDCISESGKIIISAAEDFKSKYPSKEYMKEMVLALREKYELGAPEVTTDKMSQFSLDIKPTDTFMELGGDPCFMEEFVLLVEGVRQDWNKECKIFEQMFGRDLNTLGDINSPSKKVTLNIGGKKMQFTSARGYSISTGRRVDRYAQVPTSIHNFNVNRDQVVNDKIGIADAIMHQFNMMDHHNFDKNMKFADAAKKYGLQPDKIIFKQCGEIGLTFRTKADGIGINIEPDLTVHDGELAIAMESVDPFGEGVFNSIVKATTKFANKLKSFIGKKSLGALQRNDLPESRRQMLKPMIIGTDIPINGIKGPSAVDTPVTPAKESTEIIQEMMSEGYEFTDDFETAFTESIFDNSSMSKREIKKAIDALRSKFDVEILFLHRRHNPMGGRQSADGAYVMRATDEMLKDLKSGKQIDLVSIADTFEPDKIDTYKSVIVIVPSVLARENITTAYDLEVLISHEYGHVLTFDQVSDDDWIEYGMKQEILKYCSSLLVEMLGYGTEEALATINVYYHKLKPEMLANQAGKVDPNDIIKQTFKSPPRTNQDIINFDELVSWKIQPNVLDIYRQSRSNPDVLKTSENYKILIDSSIEIYGMIIIPIWLRKNIIAGIRLAAQANDPNQDSGNNLVTRLSDDEAEQLLQKKKFHGPAHYIKKKAKKIASKFGEETEFSEASGDINDMKPESDHPIRDALIDIDRKTVKTQQAAKKKVQELDQAGRAFIKPVQRTGQWIGNMVHQWRDANENNIKEKLADPHARKNLFSTIGEAIKIGSLAKAGLLLNPIFLFLTITRGINNNKKIVRMRNEMLGELDAEMEIISEKIHQADLEKKYKEKYRLMRFKKELEKKKLRVGGGKKISRVL